VTCDFGVASHRAGIYAALRYSLISPPRSCFAADGEVAARDWFGLSNGWSLVERTVWAVAVEVLRIDLQDGVQMPVGDDQEPIGALAAHTADPPFRDRVRLRGLRRREHTAVPAAAKTVSKAVPLQNLLRGI
jgi:hypothetical protein